MDKQSNYIGKTLTAITKKMTFGEFLFLLVFGLVLLYGIWLLIKYLTG